MTLVAALTLAQEANGRAQYVETPVGDNLPVIGTLSVEDWALPKPTPSAIRVTVEFYEAARPRTAPTPDASRATTTRQETLREGDEVTIIKNTMAGMKYPPEWLEQYLGRTGKVLWTTRGGAMIRLDDETSWFSYAELSVTK
jgi:hypothetical protein